MPLTVKQSSPVTIISPAVDEIIEMLADNDAICAQEHLRNMHKLMYVLSHNRDENPPNEVLSQLGSLSDMCILLENIIKDNN